MNSKHQTIAKKTQNKQNPPKNQTKKLSLAACLIKLYYLSLAADFVVQSYSLGLALETW